MFRGLLIDCNAFLSPFASLLLFSANTREPSGILLPQVGGITPPVSTSPARFTPDPSRSRSPVSYSCNELLISSASFSTDVYIMASSTAIFMLWCQRSRGSLLSFTAACTCMLQAYCVMCRVRFYVYVLI